MAVLQLSIIRAQNIPIGDTKTSDPYVKIYQVFAGKEMKVARTSVLKETLNPEWNENFNMSGLRGMDFILRLYDHDKIGHDDYLASVHFSASNPLFPLEQEVTLRMKVEDKYKSDYKKGKECRLVIKLSVIEVASGAKASYDAEVKAVTLGLEESKTIPVSEAKHYYSYLYFETQHAFDRLIPFKKPVNKRKDLEKDPVVLPEGWIAPPPPDFKSVPFMEQNCFGVDKKFKPVIECYGGEEKEKGIKFSAWNPLVSPEGCVTTGYRFIPSKLFSETDTAGFGIFLRSPLINWDEFTNIKFVIVDLGEEKKKVKTSKGKEKYELDTDFKKVTPLASVNITPDQTSGGVLFLRMQYCEGQLVVTAPKPVTPKAPQIPWVTRSYRDILPEAVIFLTGNENCIDPSKPITRKFLTYPKTSVNVQEESFILTGTKKLTEFMVGLGWESKTNLDAIIVTAEKGENGTTPSQVCDYVSGSIFDGAIVHSGNRMVGMGMGDDETISVNLEKVPENVKYIGVVICSAKGKDFTDVKNAYTRIVIKDTEIVRANLSKSKKKTSVFSVLFYRSKEDSSQWGLLQVNHFMDLEMPHMLADLVCAQIDRLRKSGFLN